MTPQRIQLRRTKGWRKPEGAVVVARPTKWGNPYTVAEMRKVWPDATDAQLRRFCVSDFRGLVTGRWDGFDDTPSYVLPEVIRQELCGKDLACWCPLDQPCHADVLLELANTS